MQSAQSDLALSGRDRVEPATLLRQAECARKRRPTPALAGLLILFALNGCASLGEKQRAAGQARLSEKAAAFAESEELRAKISELEKTNSSLTKRVSELEAERKSALAAAAAAKSALDQAAAAAEAQGAAAIAAAKSHVDEAARSATEGDGRAPIESAPRLVQPSFASTGQTVFENEADGDTIRLSSVLFGVHLASYRGADEARLGWSALQRQHPDQLGLLDPRLEAVDIKDRGRFLRLIAGGFANEETARALCEVLKRKGEFCAVANFTGARLARSQ